MISPGLSTDPEIPSATNTCMVQSETSIHQTEQTQRTQTAYSSKVIFRRAKQKRTSVPGPMPGFDQRKRLKSPLHGDLARQTLTHTEQLLTLVSIDGENIIATIVSEQSINRQVS